MQSKQLSKREFIKLSLCGLGGLIYCPLYAYKGGPLNASDPLWKWSKEAMFTAETPRGIRCMICPNECTLKPDELSDCRNRINKNGTLYTIAYGNPCAIHVDPVEKKPLYHFMPESRVFSIATAGCNLACLNCQNYTISQKSPTETKNYDLMPHRVVEQSIKNNCPAIAYTYSEPITWFEYTTDTSILAHQAGLKNILVSAGFIKDEPLRYLCAHIDAANIDLKSFKDSIYLKLNAGKLQVVLDTLLTMHDEGVWLEITNLIVPGWTDDFVMIREMCTWLVSHGLGHYPLHFSRFFPQYKLTQLPPTPISTLNKAREIALEEGVQFVYIGNVPGSNASNTFCPDCNKMLIERRGYQIMNNHIVNGQCEFCKSRIPGVWNS